MKNLTSILTITELDKLSENSLKNAKSLLEDAKTLANNKKFGHAYFLLTICIEELAKSKLCLMAQQKFRPNPIIIIEDSKIKNIFSGKNAHNEKRITTLTQQIFILTNTFDTDFIQKVTSSIRKADPFSVPELLNLFRLFKKIDRIRNMAIYAEFNGKSPGDISENDFNELLDVCTKDIERANAFVTIKNIEYKDIEKNVQKMLDQLRDNEGG